MTPFFSAYGTFPPVFSIRRRQRLWRDKRVGKNRLFEFDVDFVEALIFGGVGGVGEDSRHPRQVVGQRASKSAQQVGGPVDGVHSPGCRVPPENGRRRLENGKQESIRWTGWIESSDIGRVDRIHTIRGKIAGVRIQIAIVDILPPVGQSVAVGVVERIGDVDRIEECSVSGGLGDFDSGERGALRDH